MTTQEMFPAEPTPNPVLVISCDTCVMRDTAACDDCLVSVLCADAEDEAMVVTHVTPIKSMVRLALDAPTESLYRMELSPCSFTSAMWFADGVASLRFFNDTAHLRGVPGDATGHHEGAAPR